MYAKNLLNFLTPMLKDGAYAPDFSDEVIAGALLTHEGKIMNESIRQLVEGAE
jgi:NAD(P) transhydrogenase subunit alpha